LPFAFLPSHVAFADVPAPVKVLPAILIVQLIGLPELSDMLPEKLIVPPVVGSIVVALPVKVLILKFTNLYLMLDLY